jgi:uncharacterized membrane protein
MAKKQNHQNIPKPDTDVKDLRAQKKAAIINSDEKGGGFLLPIIIGILLVAGVVGGYMFWGGKSDVPSSAAVQNAPQEVLSVADNLVTYPVAMFADGKARHFDFKDGQHTIRYFVLKSEDGILRAAFDACDVCWPAGKGYDQEGNAMVCRNCGQRFASNKVNEVKGGCNPAPLNRRVEGDRLVIETDDIRAGRGYFDFKGKV